MKTVLYNVLIFSFLASLTGCVAVNFQSNVKADAKTEFRRILIESRLAKVSPTYLPTFQAAFPAGYQVCTVSNSPLSFDSPEQIIEKQRQTCQSEVLLTIGFNRSYTSGSGESIRSNKELFLEMKSLATGQSFWKAIVTTRGSDEIPPREIVAKLIKDGIIEGNLPIDNSVSATN